MDVVSDSSNQSPGKHAPFSEFYRSEYPGLARLAWLLSHGSIDFEDVVQNAFASVHDRYDTLVNPAAYTRVAVVNGCRQAYRRRQRETARTRAAAPEWTEAPPTDVDVLRAVACLPYDQRAVLALRYWADVPDGEIAVLLGIRPATVRTRLHRAMATLRKDPGNGN